MPLKVTIPEREFFNERTSEFVYLKSQTLVLEHSLVSISKWEAKWRKSFLSRNKNDKLTVDELIDYIKCMTLTQNVDPELYKHLPNNIVKEIVDYIDAPMTATTFHGKDKKTNDNHVITSEEIYYWMISLGITFECQKWHLNRLLTLIRICNVKNSSDKKMSKMETMNQNRMLNAQRRAALKSRG